MRVVIPIWTDEEDPFQGLDLDLGGSGIGMLPDELRALASQHIDEFDGERGSLPIAWFELPRWDEEQVRTRTIELLGLMHLVADGVSRIGVAWVFDGTPTKLVRVEPLRLRLNGSKDFVMPARVDEAFIAAKSTQIREALARASWLRITLEHMLLGLDRNGLSDGLLDTSISLESLIRDTTQNEVAYKFSHMISRVTAEGTSNIRDTQYLLQTLYGVRSDHVHGNEILKKRKTDLEWIHTNRSDADTVLRDAARYAVTFFSSSEASRNTDEDWMTHLRNLMFEPQSRLSIDWWS